MGWAGIGAENRACEDLYSLPNLITSEAEGRESSTENKGKS